MELVFSKADFLDHVIRIRTVAFLAAVIIFHSIIKENSSRMSCRLMNLTGQ